MNKKAVTFVLLLVAIPLVVIGGTILFKEKYYAWVSLCVALLSCIPLYYTFEKKDNSSKELIVLAVMVAISATGRFIFAWFPSFKPVTAITIIAAIWLGKEVGFTIGSLSAVISNFYFGQGPWTSFQMFAWGLIGFLAGVIAKPLRESRVLICVYGALAGMLYSVLMDVWTTIWADGYFNLRRYGAVLLSSLSVTVEYVVSNVIFLLVLAKPIGEKLERLKKKYGLFHETI